MRGGAPAATPGFSRGCYITADLMLIEQETAQKVDKKKRTELGWIYFRSKREAKVWIRLKYREAAGEISNLRRGRQTRLNLTCPTFKDPGDLFERPPTIVTTWEPDYVFEENGVTVYADAKGFPDAVYELKKKWVLAQHGIEIREL